MLTTLALRTLARHRALIVGMAAVLSGFQVLLVVIARNLQREGLFAQMSAFIPPSFQAALGGNMLASFGGMVAFGFFHPVVVLALAIGGAYLASELAGDVEEGLVDLIAARPVPRAVLVARTTAAALLASACVVALMLATNRIATQLLAPGGALMPHAGPLARVAANVLAVTWCCAGIGLVAASVARRRATAAGTATIVFISLYLVNFAATVWTPARPFARLAPFHYFDAMAIMVGAHDPTRHILGLLVATAVLSAIALAAYQRRDL